MPAAVTGRRNPGHAAPCPGAEPLHGAPGCPRYPGRVPVDRVILAEPRGFCAGVEKAIKALAWMVRVFEPPVYCYHEIVHNRHVVDQFIAQGVIFVDDVSEVPPGAPLMLSAHGSAPDVVERARKGYTVLYVGHHGHEEAVGTMAVAPEAVRLLERVEDVDALDLRPSPDGGEQAVALLAQTTLSHDEWAGIVDRARERFPDLWMPNRSDLCFATTNRQAALRALAGVCDAVVVIGSENSSNTVALTQVAEAFGCPRVVRVNAASELPDDLSGTVGVPAGASAPKPSSMPSSSVWRRPVAWSTRRSRWRRSTSLPRPSCVSSSGASRPHSGCSTRHPGPTPPGCAVTTGPRRRPTYWNRSPS